MVQAESSELFRLLPQTLGSGVTLHSTRKKREDYNHPLLVVTNSECSQSSGYQDDLASCPLIA